MLLPPAPDTTTTHHCPQVFPAVARDGKLFAMQLEGYWMDVGQPKDYLTGGWMWGVGGQASRRKWCICTPCIHPERWQEPAISPTFPRSASLSAGLGLHLAALRNRNPAALAEGAHIQGNAIIDETAKIGKDCLIGPNVAIGKL